MMISRLLLGGLLFCVGCQIQTPYTPPVVVPPKAYKTGGFQIAHPQDECERGVWWSIFKDATLDQLMTVLNQENLTIADAKAHYDQAKAMVDQATAAYFPTVGLSSSRVRQKPMQTSLTSPKSSTLQTIGNSVAWEADVWNSIGSAVSAQEATADASRANVLATRLSMQATLATCYFQLRTLDFLQDILDSNVKNYQKLLAVTQSRITNGVASRLDRVIVDSQLKSAQVMAIDNHIARTQLENAMATLIGKAACDFTLSVDKTPLSIPTMPVNMPSQLLERRPDIAKAERTVAAANAELGVAQAAFFPTFSFNGNLGFERLMASWLSVSTYVWSLGPQMALTLFDGGLRNAQEAYATAVYEQTVVNYKQTVLYAFQEVEDNLIALKHLADELSTQKEAVKSAVLQYDLTQDEYVNGTVAISDVMAAHINLYNSQSTLNTIQGRLLTAVINLIKSLGGGFAGVSAPGDDGFGDGAKARDLPKWKPKKSSS